MKIFIPFIRFELKWRSLSDLLFNWRRQRWEKHAWGKKSCVRCHDYASNGGPDVGNFPCLKGRQLLDRMYPDSVSERADFFRSKGLL